MYKIYLTLQYYFYASLKKLLSLLKNDEFIIISVILLLSLVLSIILSLLKVYE